MSEHDEQAALVQWARYYAAQYPRLARLYAIPNGGHRSKRTAGLLKAEGVRAGVLDLCLPVPVPPYHGMYLEMKFGYGKLRPEQKAEMVELMGDGYYVPLPCYSWQDAAVEICKYLSLPMHLYPYSGKG